MIPLLEPELIAELSGLDDPGRPQAMGDVDRELDAAVHTAGIMRRVFYVAVLVVALYGTATGAVAAFELPWWIAAGGIFALELGGVVFLSNADLRRRVGETAAASRLLGGMIAAAAATFNLVTHDSRLLGGFFALMSGLGFASWWLDVENKRRDRLRAHGHLPPPSPKYELWSHWIRHPMLTIEARALAKAHPALGVYGSLRGAVILRRQHRRNSALAGALRTRIRTAVGRDLADIAVLTLDLDEVARRLRATADYDGLTAMLGSELTAEQLLAKRHGRASEAADAHDVAREDHRGVVADRADPRGDGQCGHELVAGATDADASGSGRVRVRILDELAIIDDCGSRVNGLRAKSQELLVYLAVHREGAAIPDILNAVWPDVDTHRAGQRLSTCVANLRSVLRGVIEASTDGAQPSAGAACDPVVNTGGRYRLDPAVVSLDYWEALDAQRSGSASAAGTGGLAFRGQVAVEPGKIMVGVYGYPWMVELADDLSG